PELKMKLSMAIALLGVSSMTLAQQDAMLADPALPMQDHWGFVDQYCAECHNFEDWAGSLVLEGLGADSIVDEPDIWEEVIRKLNAGMMPPTGQPRPDAEEQEAFVAALETSLDNAVALQPNPGSVQLHRLNRTEYAHAIEDM